MFNNLTKLSKIKNILRIITFLYFIWIIFGRNINKAYMIWNIILTWIPLEIASLINNLYNKKNKNAILKIAIGLLGILWLLFYPNSPYIITDFIHISPNDYYIVNPNYSLYSNEPRILFNDNFSIWCNFVTIAVGIWIGYAVGFISLYTNQKIVEKTFNKVVSWIFVVIINFLSGYAIYLGRFVRWNSWDVFNPYNLGKILINNLHSKAINFTIIFGFLCLILYVINYLIASLKNDIS